MLLTLKYPSLVAILNFLDYFHVYIQSILRLQLVKGADAAIKVIP